MTRMGGERELASSLFQGEDKRGIILFDGVCNMCNGGVNLVLDLDDGKSFRFAALQSPAGMALLERGGRQRDDISSIILSTPDATYDRSEAILRIGVEMFGGTLLFPLALLSQAAIFLVPAVIRDTVYDFVADNRYSFLGKRDECRLDDDRYQDCFLPD